MAGLDGRRPVRIAKAVGLAALALAGSAPARAENTREYFVARTTRSTVPAQLSVEDRAYYRNVFSAIDNHDWARVQATLAQRSDGLLTTLATAEFYTAANSPKVSLEQIEQWLQKGSRLPEAEQL